MTDVQTETPAEATPAPTPSKNIFDNSVCVSVKLSKPGNYRRVGSSQVEVDADKDMLRVSKELFRSARYKAIDSLDNQIRRFLQDLALPASSMCRGGVYLLPVGLAVQADDALRDFQKQREKLVEEFLLEYGEQDTSGEEPVFPFLMALAEKLRVLYNEHDYPTVQKLRSMFSMEVTYTNMGVPDALKGISRSIFDRETQRQAIKVAEAADEIKLAMRMGMAQLVDHMLDRLKPDANGKPKKWHYTLVENMRLFLSTFDARNIANDQQLADVVSKARLVLDGVDPKTLRENQTVRSYVSQGMDTIKASLDQLVVTGPTRLILDEDDDAPDPANG